MERRTLTIIDTKGRLLDEVELNEFGKEHLIFGRNSRECDIVVQDSIISKIHGSFELRENQTLYMDNDSGNGTFIGNAKEKRLLRQSDGYVELYDKAVLRIGNIQFPDKMVLILYRVMEEGERWESQPLELEDITIGRSSENKIILPHPAVSKKHCCIEKQGKDYILRDLNSANGTMVNGRDVTEPIVLQDKDLIQILDYQLFYSSGCIHYKAENKGISLRVSDVSKFVGKGKKRKQILRNVDCEILGNEFVAIIGGSGAGKTTLMNAISGFEPSFSGEIFCNGINLVEQFQNLKNIIGFVPQQDIIYENLTLRKMLFYTAKMKMPEDTQKDEIEQRISEVLNMVELSEHQHTFIRKLSGGQKKRASIAVELLADPKLFFLDEPTSGLDPGTEKNLMQTLKKLAKEQNKTIIMVTHTTANLHLCDKIIFMGPGGRLCFCGNVNEAKQFYRTDDLVNIYNKIADSPEAWERRYAEYRSRKENHSRTPSGKAEPLKKRKDSGFRQFSILTQRYAELMKNDRQRLSVLLMQPFLIAVLLYIVADKKVFQIFESTKSMMFALSCSGIWIGLFNSIQEICKERVIVRREYMANLRLTGYMLSKFVLQAVLGLVQSAILVFVFLGLVGKWKAGIFLNNFGPEMLVTVWLTVLTAEMMGFVISSIVETGDKAMAVAPFVLIIQLLFSGILFELKGVGEMISYCTVSRWSVEGLGSIAKLNRLDLKLQADYPMLKHEAEAFFKATKPHLLSAWGILALMTVFFMSVSIFMLRNVAKDSR